MRKNIVIAMPAHNESFSIRSFLPEISASLSGFECSFVLVDDMSTDDTVIVFDSTLRQIDRSGTVIFNSQNLGHGPSTVKGLQHALLLNPDYVISVDGDGQFIGTDILDMLKNFQSSGADLAIGVRKNRNDPGFRKVVSSVTRMLLWAFSGLRVRDANCPLRIYSPHVLRTIIGHLPQNPLVPNLLILKIVSKLQLKFVEIEVVSIPRRGYEKIGTMWKSKLTNVPSKRFVSFCLRAIVEFFRFR
jgi:glycosyltransferase involved in cell wall biosynthesis